MAASDDVGCDPTPAAFTYLGTAERDVDGFSASTHARVSCGH